MPKSGRVHYKLELMNRERVVSAFERVFVDFMRKHAPRRVTMWGNVILQDSKNSVPKVPRETGLLEQSGRWEGPKKTREDAVQVEVVYGNAQVDYAWIVHEDMDPKKFTEGGSGPKYVEAHVVRRAPEFEEDVKKDVELAFRNAFAGIL